MLSLAGALVLLYVLPGLALARFFRDRPRYDPALWILLSLFSVPVALSTLGALGAPTRSRLGLALLLVALSGAFFALTSWARRAGFVLALPVPAPQPRSARIATAAIAVLLVVVVGETHWALVLDRTPTVYDDFHRLGHTTAVAVTGVPPRNLYVPEALLSYYYYDWMIPGLAVRLAEPEISVSQAIFFHMALQTLVVAVAIAGVLGRLLPPWPALLGFWWLSFGSTWAVWPLSRFNERASMSLDAFAGGTFSLELLAKLNVWVPQHMIAASTVVFGLALIGLVRGPLRLRAAGFGLLLAFVAGSSVFVALGLGAGLLLWSCLLRSGGANRWTRRESGLALVVAGVLSLSVVPAYLHRAPALLLNFPARYLSAEASAELGGSRWGFLEAQVRSAARVPVHLFVEGGAPLALFVLWLWRERRHLREPVRGFLAAMGTAFLPWPYLFRSPLYNDFGMKGILPGQFAWCLAAAMLLAAPLSQSARRGVWALAIAGTLATIPMFFHDAIYITDLRNAEALPAYVAFIHAHSSLDTPVVVAEPLAFLRTPARYHIERLHPIDPWFVPRLDQFDRQYLQSDEFLALPLQPRPRLTSKTDVCREASRGRTDAYAGSVMLLASAQAASARYFGPPHYRDGEVQIFVVDCRE